MEMSLRFPSRILSVFFVILKWIFARNAVVHGEWRELDGPRRLLLILEELGGIYLKFGQILAMRIDLIPARYAAELMNLFSNVTPLPNKIFFEAFERATGKKPQDVFERIDENPIGVASFAQVYKGLLDDMPVAIKIQKPNAGRDIKEDLRVLRFIIQTLKRFGFLRTVSTSQLLGQFSRWLRQELDYRIEAANLLEMAGQVIKRGLEQRVRIPRLYSQFVTKTTLVEGFLDGMSVEDIIRGRKRLSPAKRLRAAQAFQRDLMRQSWIDGFFHADPHPGNLLVFDDGSIGYIDFGIMGVATTAPLHFLRFIEGAVNRDAHYSARQLMYYAHKRLKNEAGELFLREPKYQEAADIILDFIAERLAQSLTPLMDEWHAQAGDTKLSLFERSSSVAFYKIVWEASKFGVTFPSDSIAFVRTLLIIDMVCLNLSPKFNMVESAKGFFAEFSMERAEKENPLFIAEQKAGARPIFSPHLLGNSVGREWDVEYNVHKKSSAKYRYLHNRQMLIRQVNILAERYPELYTKLREVL